MGGRITTAVVTAIADAAAIAGCGSPGPASYLASGSWGVMLVQWTPGQHGAVSGTLTADVPHGRPPSMTVSPERLPFSGRSATGR